MEKMGHSLRRLLDAPPHDILEHSHHARHH
jgi:hypothetical protein